MTDNNKNNVYLLIHIDFLNAENKNLNIEILNDESNERKL